MRTIFRNAKRFGIIGFVLCAVAFVVVVSGCARKTGSQSAVGLQTDSISGRTAPLPDIDLTDQEQAAPGIASQLAFDSALIREYDSAKVSADKDLRPFMDSVRALMVRFNGRVLDTTIVTKANFRGNGALDTLLCRVWWNGAKIIDDEVVKMGADTVWNSRFEDRNFDIQTPAYNKNGKIRTWELFVAEVLGGAAGTYLHEKNILRDSLAVEFGAGSKSQDGKVLDTLVYAKYLDSFSGDLLDLTGGEYEGGVYVWYEPFKMFLPYYLD